MAEQQVDDFHAGMRQAQVTPLWERTDTDDWEPVSEPPCHWQWEKLSPLFDQAVDATSMGEVERRVLTLKNPAMADHPGPCATTNLTGAFQVLLPGEAARVHRHTANALRFVAEGSGARTIVDGKSCLMEEGDLILTPGWTWHEHVHDGEGRIVWLDSLDVSLHRHLGHAFFEPGPNSNFPDLPPDETYAAGGLVPELDSDTGQPAYSPLFRYPWGATVAALADMPAAGDGSRRLRYVNPATGGAVMSLMDCYMVALPKGAETTPVRSTSHALCYVAEGEGVSHVGDAEFKWSKRDVFSVPHWNWVSHKAATRDAKLFIITDREVMRRLDMLRDETRN